MKKMSEATLEEEKLKVEKRLADAARKRKEIIRLQRELRERREAEARYAIGEAIINLIGDGNWRNIDYEKLLGHIQSNQANMAIDFLADRTLDVETASSQVETVMGLMHECGRGLEGEDEACGSTLSANRQ